MHKGLLKLRTENHIKVYMKSTNIFDLFIFFITQERALLQPTIASTIISFLETTDIKTCFDVFPTWRAHANFELRLGDDPPYLLESVERSINKLCSDATVTLRNGGPNLEGGAIALLRPIFYRREDFLRSRLVEVDLRDPHSATLRFIGEGHVSSVTKGLPDWSITQYCNLC